MSKNGVELNINKAAVKWLKNKGVSAEFGAREMDRVIDRELKPLLVDNLLFGKLKNGGKCTVTVKGDKLLLLC